MELDRIDLNKLDAAAREKKMDEKRSDPIKKDCKNEKWSYKDYQRWSDGYDDSGGATATAITFSRDRWTALFMN